MRSLTLALAGGLIFSATALSAQTPRVSLELRPGVAIPTGDLEDMGVSTGIALGGDLMYSFSRSLTGYIGLSHDRFSCDEDEGPCTDPVTSTGGQAGLKFLMNRNGSVLPWLRAGLIGQKLRMGEDGSQFESDLSWGFEGGLGLDLDLSSNFSLVPAINFRRYEADTAGPGNFDARWLTGTLAAHIHFR
jgi:hypothetical protein